MTLSRQNLSAAPEPGVAPATPVATGLPCLASGSRHPLHPEPIQFHQRVLLQRLDNFRQVLPEEFFEVPCAQVARAEEEELPRLAINRRADILSALDDRLARGQSREGALRTRKAGEDARAPTLCG